MAALKASLLFGLGLLLIACCFAHAFSGWPVMSEELAANSISDDTLGGLQMGWYFGSVAFLVFGILTVIQAWQVFHQKSESHYSATVIGLGLIMYSGMGWMIRNFDSHYLMFFLLGLLLVAIGLVPVRFSHRSDSVH